MTPRTLITAVLVILAAGTGLAWPQYPVWVPPSGTLWPGESIPTFPDAKPVKVISYPRGLTQEGFEDRWQPVWELMARQAQAQAETVPTPPARPAVDGPETLKAWPKEPRAKRIAPEADLCARHGLKKTYTDKYRWRCR